jgi:hypothetical protein
MDRDQLQIQTLQGFNESDKSKFEDHLLHFLS